MGDYKMKANFIRKAVNYELIPQDEFVIEKEVLIDSTVQEKNITYPTDAKLHKRIIEKVNKIAQQEGIILSDAYSFIASGSNVRKNVPPYMKAARDPLTFAGVNSVGLRRRGFSADTVLQIEDIYRYIYTRGLNVSNAVRIIEQEAPKSDEKDIILGFIEDSTKGIIRGPLN